MGKPGNPTLGDAIGEIAEAVMVGALRAALGTAPTAPAKKLKFRAKRLGAVAGAVPWLLDRTLVYKAKLGVDADGAPNAYHPDDKGTDKLAHAGHAGAKGKPNNWWGVATDNGKASGEPVKQTGGAYPGYFVSTTAWVNPGVSDDKVPQRYVDSNKIPYVAIRDTFRQGANGKVKLGDYAVVVHLSTSKFAYAVVADVKFQGIGEGSIALCRALGADADPRKGGIATRDVVYVVFAGSGDGTFPVSDPAVADGAKDPKADQSVAHIAQVGAQKLRDWAQANLAYELSQSSGAGGLSGGTLGGAGGAGGSATAAAPAPSQVAAVLNTELSL